MVAESKISAESSAMTVLESKTAPSSKGQPDLAPLRAAYKNVDGYQPVYKLEDHFADRSVSRICRDRCAFLHEHIGAESRNLRILDVGCSMGYISLYFAEIGAQVTGLDYQQTNVAFCRILSETLGIKATFERNDFSLELCNSLREGQYDVVFIFSVLHHVINKYGLLATQTMMAELLDKTDVLYVELARNSEDVSFDWKGRLPADELEIFAGIPGLEVERLKDFPALGGTTIRPLYRVRKSAKTFNGIRHLDIKVSRSFIRDGRSSDRKYFVTDHLFTKAFIFSKAGPETYNKFCREVATYHRIAGHPNFLPMLGCEIRGNLGLLTLPHIGSPTLLDELPNGRFRLRQTSIAVISILRALADAGLYWNDFRAHNMAFYGSKLIAVDFEFASAVEIENTRHLFLWLLWDLQSRKSQTDAHRPFKHGVMDVPQPPIEIADYVGEIRDLASAALSAQSFQSFIANTRHIAD